MVHKIKTAETTVFDDFETLIDGNEHREDILILGNIIRTHQLGLIYQHCRGLPRYWACEEKARVAHNIMGRGTLVIGSLFIDSSDYKSDYGFDFKPNENSFHAWVEIGSCIVDVSLPFVIEKGLATEDEAGPALIGRDPFVLAGIPPSWTRYTKGREL